MNKFAKIGIGVGLIAAAVVTTTVIYKKRKEQRKADKSKKMSNLTGSDNIIPVPEENFYSVSALNTAYLRRYPNDSAQIAGSAKNNAIIGFVNKDEYNKSTPNDYVQIKYPIGSMTINAKYNALRPINDISQLFVKRANLIKGDTTYFLSQITNYLEKQNNTQRTILTNVSNTQSYNEL
ncbi:MAG: hypothetical protein WCT77_11625 [Bacteroidota bacterium]